MPAKIALTAGLLEVVALRTATGRMLSMLLSRLAETWNQLSATRSRNAKRDLIAAVLADATPDDIEVVVSYLSGELRQRRTGLGWRSLQSLPPPASTSSLEVSDVDRAFEDIATLSGPGSAGARAGATRDLFARATEAEQNFLRGLIFGDLRQGALESQVQEGLAAAFTVPLASVRRAAMLLSSTSAAARLAITGGGAALDAVTLQVGTAVQPMLAASAPNPEDAVAKTGLPAIVDFKLDGVRVQVHRKGPKITIFTRSLDDVTARMPDVVALVADLPSDQIVLDGEVLALNTDGRPELFQVVASRTMSSADVPAAAERLPLQAFFFDLLRVDDHDLLDQPLTRRIEVMAKILPPSLIVPRAICSDLEEVSTVFSDAVTKGYEGLVVKNPSAPYAAGRRDSAWVKLKPRQTFDLIVIAAEWGHGRRRGWLSNLHLAARDPSNDQLIMLGKTFKGLTDEMLAWQTEQFLAREVRRSAGAVYVEPSLVVEVACDGLQASTRYPGGVALRFARILRYRPDKSAAEADTIDTVKALSVKRSEADTAP
ncbi:MAG TPA: ATP-dependent DNA ligase [Propionibacteriaceae bacterium]|nr:ATP-dependent DNA ligase [Propionibacteriaceae bacterium]